MQTGTRGDPWSRRWWALGTYVYLSVGDPSVLEAAESIAREVLGAVDRACSRFRDNSDLARANARPGTWVPVDQLLVEATAVAVEAASETQGLVDPCLGRAMVYLGYDADLDVVRRRHHPHDLGPPPAPRPDAWRDIGLDREGAIRVPVGCALDLGATAKAWASDLVAATVADRRGCQVIVSLGGDVSVYGPPDLPLLSWPVSITERPDTGADADAAELVWLDSGGLATSSTTVRRWTAGGRVNHHLLDPRTGQPVSGRWRTVTATGPTSVAANTASTAALVHSEKALSWLTEKSVTARLVDVHGQVTTTGSWPAPPPSATRVGM